MPVVQIRGVNHYYEWICQSSQPGTKPVMVFMHGWGGSARYWESTAQALSAEFDCLLYDGRGFGRSRLSPELLSSPEASYALETYAEDLAELLDQLQLHRVYLNAHSTGTSIAVFFLNLYPERVERAILTCAGVFEYEEKSFRQFHRFGSYVVKFRPAWLAKIPGMNRLFMARFLHRPLPAKVSQAFLEDFLMADEAAALGTMLDAVSQRAAEVMPQEFAKVTVPTLLVAGEHDIIIPAHMGQEAARFNPQIEFVEIPQAAHFPMLEAPDVYLHHVRQFCQGKVPPTSAEIG